MRLSWIRNIFLFSTVVVLLASCKEQEFSKDEPLIPELRPAIYISGQNNFLYALDPKTGDRIWEKFFGVNTIVQEPLILKDFAFVATTLGIVQLDADKGTVIDTLELEFDGAKHPASGKISGMDEIIYTGTSDNHIVAYNFVKKAIVWQTTLSGPAVMNSAGSFFNKLFIVNIENTVYALNKNQGSEVSWTYVAPGPINNPVIAAPNMYVLGTDGILHAVDLETGVEVWSYTTGASTNSAPIVYGGNIIYGADNYKLYCIDSIAHTPRWTFTTNERIKGSAFAADQAVYFGSYDHYVYSVDIIAGELNWRYRTGALVQSSPIVNNGIVYYGSFDQHLYAFDTSGAMKWKFKTNAPLDLSPVANNLDNKVVYPAVSGLSPQ